MPDPILILFVGPPGAGKSANLRSIRARGPSCTEGSPQALSLDLGRLGGVPAQLQLRTRDLAKLDLGQADGVVLVCDSQAKCLPANRAAFAAVEAALARRPGPPLPVVIQWNKRDLRHTTPVCELELRLNPRGMPAFPASTKTGLGVLNTLGALVGMILAQRDHPPAEQDLNRTLIEELEVPPAAPRGSRRPPPPQLAGDLIGQHVGPCRVISKLGEGGMGAVFLAEHESLGKRVVVKTLKPSLAQDPRRVSRFFLEARAAARLDHPHIVAVQDVGTTRGGLHYIVMQYVEGEDLRRRVESRGPLQPEEALRVVLAVGLALEALHAVDIVHRDVKSENVVLTPEGEVKLIDFGLAKDLRAQANLTRVGALLGTPAYMAPEIGRVPDIDGRVDIYSLGLTFYQLLTGLQPFDGYPFQAVILGRARLVPPQDAVPGLDTSYTDVLARMLAWDRDERYSDATTLVADLRGLAEGRPPSGGRPPSRIFDLALARQALGRDPRPIPPTIPPGGEDETRRVARNAAQALTQVPPPPALTQVPPPPALTQVPPPPALPAPTPIKAQPATLGPYVVLETLQEEHRFTLFAGWDPNAQLEVRLRRLRVCAQPGPPCQRELRAASRFEHPRSPRLRDHHLVDGTLVLVSDRSQAKPLSATLARPGPVDLRGVVRAVSDVAGVLAALHERGLVHGSLRLHSVGVDGAGRGVLLDLDLAALRLGLAQERGLPLGDGENSPPECRSGRRPTPRSDVYAVGVVLAGMLPEQETRLLHDLRAICRCAHERRPERRYRDMLALACDLERALRGEVPRALPWRHRLASATRGAGRLPSWARVVGSILALALVVALYTARSQAQLAEVRSQRLEALLGTVAK